MNRKILIGILGLLGTGFIVFNNFIQSIVLLKTDIRYIMALIISLIVSITYGILNKEQIIK